MPTPPQDIAAFLNTNVAALTIGTNLFHGPLKPHSSDMPIDSTYCRAGAGPEPFRTMGEVTEHRMAVVHIHSRYGDWDAGDTVVRAIADTLRGATIAGYKWVAALQSEPPMAISDEQGYHHWDQSFKMVYEQT